MVDRWAGGRLTLNRKVRSLFPGPGNLVSKNEITIALPKDSQPSQSSFESTLSFRSILAKTLLYRKIIGAAGLCVATAWH